MQKLRRPMEKLADCVWFPRFIDKVRHHLAGTLAPDFVRPFGHRFATDGAFLAHFGLSGDDLIEAVRRSAGNDAYVVAWFCRCPGYSAATVAAWNALAPNLGKPGYPVHRGFQLMLKTYYGGTAPDPRVDSAFTAIAYDEGFLD